MIKNIVDLITALKKNLCIESCVWNNIQQRHDFKSIENLDGFIEIKENKVIITIIAIGDSNDPKFITEFPIDKKKFMEINAFINVYDMDSIKDEVYVDHNGDLDWGEQEDTEIVEINDDATDCPDDDEIATTDPKELQLRIEVMSRLFNAYSQLDFTDLCEMINYRGGLDFTEANCSGLSAKDYFKDTSEINTQELQDYIYAICIGCYKRWLYEHNNPDEADSEYYQNHILVTISKDGSVCEINYTPISVVSEN